MGYQLLPSTMEGALTMCCSECGVSLGYDVEVGEYVDRFEELESWCCPDCRKVSRPLKPRRALVVIELPHGTKIRPEWWRPSLHQAFVIRQTKHPVSDDGRQWDLMHLQCADRTRLDAAILSAGRRLWEPFLVSPHLPRALLYKPSGATPGWQDILIDRRRIA